MEATAAVSPPGVEPTYAQALGREGLADGVGARGSKRCIVNDDLSAGLEPGHRFRCDACGNVTRFDVLATARTRRYHHFDLGGSGSVEEEEVLSRTIESVTCRWCGRSDAVHVEPAPVARS